MAVLRMRNEKYAIWPLRVAEFTKNFFILLEIGVVEHDGDAGFLTGSRNVTMGQIPCSTERISCYRWFERSIDQQLRVMSLLSETCSDQI